MSQFQGVLSWSTSKLPSGKFKATVTTVEYGKPSKTIYSDTRPTRPRAATAGKQAIRYFKAMQSRGELTYSKLEELSQAVKQSEVA